MIAAPDFIFTAAGDHIGEAATSIDTTLECLAVCSSLLTLLV